MAFYPVSPATFIFLPSHHTSVFFILGQLLLRNSFKNLHLAPAANRDRRLTRWTVVAIPIFLLHS